MDKCQFVLIGKGCFKWIILRLFLKIQRIWLGHFEIAPLWILFLNLFTKQISTILISTICFIKFEYLSIKFMRNDIVVKLKTEIARKV